MLPEKHLGDVSHCVYLFLEHLHPVSDMFSSWLRTLNILQRIRH